MINPRFVKEGDTVEQFDNICEVQSDKASVTITSRYDGKVVKLYHKIDDVALVGNPLVDFDVVEEDGDSSSSSSSSSEDEAKPKQDAAAQKQILSDEAHVASHGKVLTTPAVRRIAMENKVDLTKVTPTGKYGRLLKGDLLEYLNMIPAGTVKPHPTLAHHAPACSAGTKVVARGEVRVEALKGIRKAMLKTMTESLVSFGIILCERKQIFQPPTVIP